MKPVLAEAGNAHDAVRELEEADGSQEIDQPRCIEQFMDVAAHNYAIKAIVNAVNVVFELGGEIILHIV